MVGGGSEAGVDAMNCELCRDLTQIRDGYFFGFRAADQETLEDRFGLSNSKERVFPNPTYFYCMRWEGVREEVLLLLLLLLLGWLLSRFHDESTDNRTGFAG